jgi:hypothetical protein
MSLSGQSVEGSNHVEAERAITDGQWKGAMLEGCSNRHALFEGLVSSRRIDHPGWIISTLALMPRSTMFGLTDSSYWIDLTFTSP